jgi:hypothetical protein
VFLYTSFLLFDISLLLQLIAGIAHGRVSSRTFALIPAVSPATDILKNVYVENVFAMDVVQQPEGSINYVSANNGEVTQFSTVNQYGNIGLLAHNYLSGKTFSSLSVGQEVRLTFESGRTERFIVTEILRYQALEPKNPYSSFQNPNSIGEILSVSQVFDRVYRGDYHLTFQTCIAQNGMSSWGRLFVLAAPMGSQGLAHRVHVVE